MNTDEASILPRSNGPIPLTLVQSSERLDEGRIFATSVQINTEGVALGVVKELSCHIEESPEKVSGGVDSHVSTSSSSDISTTTLATVTIQPPVSSIKESTPPVPALGEAPTGGSAEGVPVPALGEAPTGGPAGGVPVRQH